MVSLFQSLPNSSVQLLLRRAFPAVPEAIADDFNLLRVMRLQSQCRWLFFALFVTVPTAISAASVGASLWIRVILPLLVGALFLAGFFSLTRVRRAKISPRGARRFIRDATWSSPAIAALCSLWCVSSWLTAPDADKIFYPLIMAMGSLTTVYCLASVRWAAILNLVIGLLPITVLMLFSGDRMAFSAAVSLTMASVFLLRMVFEQHDQWIDLLMLKHAMQQQANTDPLTGLLNRRALDDHIQSEIRDAVPGSRFALALLDLDGFKQVNDLHGHATGDALLCEIGRRLRQACGETALVARQGGDEFAVLLSAGASGHESLAECILTALVAPCRLSDHIIRVGASVGVAHWPRDGLSGKDLFDVADRGLYSEKAATRRGSAAVRRGAAA